MGFVLPAPAFTSMPFVMPLQELLRSFFLRLFIIFEGKKPLRFSGLLPFWRGDPEKGLQHGVPGPEFRIESTCALFAPVEPQCGRGGLEEGIHQTGDGRAISPALSSRQGAG